MLRQLILINSRHAERQVASGWGRIRWNALLLVMDYQQERGLGSSSDVFSIVCGLYCVVGVVREECPSAMSLLKVPVWPF